MFAVFPRHVAPERSVMDRRLGHCFTHDATRIRSWSERSDDWENTYARSVEVDDLMLDEAEVNENRRQRVCKAR